MFLFPAAPVIALQPDVESNITYRSHGDQAMQLDFYRPVTAAEGPHPAVIVIHGGGWTSGQRQDMTTMATALSKAGFAVANVSYRLAPKDKWPAMLEDVQSATRYMRGNAEKYDVDPAKFGSAGASAGGHLALLLGLRDTIEKDTAFYPDQPSRTQAVFNLFGPTDLANDFNRTLASFMSLQIIGKPIADAGDIIKDFSPVNHVRKGNTVPTYTVHGMADALVPYRQAERLDEAMKAAGGDHTLVLIEGMGHEVPDRPEVTKAMGDALEFFNRTLR